MCKQNRPCGPREHRLDWRCQLREKERVFVGQSYERCCDRAVYKNAKSRCFFIIQRDTERETLYMLAKHQIDSINFLFYHPFTKFYLLGKFSKSSHRLLFSLTKKVQYSFLYRQFISFNSTPRPHLTPVFYEIASTKIEIREHIHKEVGSNFQNTVPFFSSNF